MIPPADTQRYKNHRFPGEIISHGVWLYYRFNLSYRDVQDLLMERGIEVSHESIRQWCGKFGQNYGAGQRGGDDRDQSDDDGDQHGLSCLSERAPPCGEQ